MTNYNRPTLTNTHSVDHRNKSKYILFILTNMTTAVVRRRDEDA